jgi:hypothetical protein
MEEKKCTHCGKLRPLSMFIGRQGQVRKQCSICVARKIASNKRIADPDYRKELEAKREESARRKAEAERKRALIASGEYFKCMVCDKVLPLSAYGIYNGKRRHTCIECREKIANRVPAFKPRPVRLKDGHTVRLMPDKECNYPTCNGATVYLVHGIGEKPLTRPSYEGLFVSVLNKYEKKESY